MDDMWWLRHPIRPPLNPSTGAALCQMTSSQSIPILSLDAFARVTPHTGSRSMTCIAAPASEHVRSACCLHALTQPVCGRASS